MTGSINTGGAGYGSFMGQSVDNTSNLVRFAFAGDSKLDAKVDLTDFTYLAANFNGTNKNWLQGDYNYDGKTDLTDFTFLASNFNQSLPASSSASMGATVPEPAMIGALGCVGLLGRARRRRRVR